MPLLAGVLLLIGALYTVRGLSLVGQMAQYLSTPGSPPLRVELIALVAGLCYLGGTLQGWEHLSLGMGVSEGFRWEPMGYLPLSPMQATKLVGRHETA